MYTLKYLAPFLAAACLEGITTDQGDICVLSEPTPVVKYYEPGKSCYVNGTFYRNCVDRP